MNGTFNYTGIALRPPSNSWSGSARIHYNSNQEGCDSAPPQTSNRLRSAFSRNKRNPKVRYATDEAFKSCGLIIRYTEPDFRCGEHIRSVDHFRKHGRPFFKSSHPGSSLLAQAQLGLQFHPRFELWHVAPVGQAVRQPCPSSDRHHTLIERRRSDRPHHDPTGRLLCEQNQTLEFNQKTHEHPLHRLLIQYCGRRRLWGVQYRTNLRSRQQELTGMREAI